MQPGGRLDEAGRQHPVQAELVLVTALAEHGLTLDEIADRVGINRLYVEQLLAGGGITLKLM